MYFINEIRLVIFFMLLLKPLSIDGNMLELKVCGFEQTCSRINKTNAEVGSNTCCRPCECSDTCAEKDTCCRDKAVLIDKNNIIKQNCVKHVYITEGYSLSTLNQLTPFFTRESCPPKAFTEKTVKEKCENYIPYAIENIRPVSSLDGKVVYKNKYCSYCHGEGKTNDWDVVIHRSSSVNCTEMFRRGTINFDTISTKLLTHCILVFVPPKNLRIWNSLCFDEAYVIKQCNVTGRWTTFEDDLNNLCLNESAGYHSFDNRGYVFRNLYCLICNGVPTVSCSNKFRRFYTIATLYNLVNVGKLLNQDSPDLRQTRHCGDDEVLDSYFATCRKLYCPTNSVPFKGKCVPFVIYSPRTGYKLLLKLILKTYIEQTNLTRYDLVTNYKLIQEKLNFADCKLCFAKTYFEKYAPVNVLHEIYLEMSFIPNARCKTENIWTKFIEAEIKLPILLNQTISKKLITFQVLWNNGLQMSPIYDKVFEIGSQQNCQVLEPKRGEICPKVKLNQSEVETLMENHPNAEHLIVSQNKDDINGSVFVCTYNYISDQRSFSSLIHFSFSLIVFSIFGLSL